MAQIGVQVSLRETFLAYQFTGNYKEMKKFVGKDAVVGECPDNKLSLIYTPNNTMYKYTNRAYIVIGCWVIRYGNRFEILSNKDFNNKYSIDTENW